VTGHTCRSAFVIWVMRAIRQEAIYVSDPTRETEQFERYRPQLQAVAYRMLGSVSEAEDAVQEAWLRLARADGDGIDNLGGWLTTVVGRVCIDMLRARRARREEPIQTGLPEPIVRASAESDPEQEALVADTVGIALLVVLDTLTPAERLAFVLHDMFAVPFDEIAPIVDRSVEATRQLASRARRRVQGAAPEPDADRGLQRRLVDAFLAASRAGDFEALLAVLDPDVVFRADAGGRVGLVRPLVVGAREVALYTAAEGPRFAVLCHPATVNGSPGLVIRTGRRRPIGAVAFTIAGGRIATVDMILDPRKLGAVEADAVW
jgi:RNA polymerase sigma factor (sigma-70 family)